MLIHVNLIYCFQVLNTIPPNRKATFYVLASILGPAVVSQLEKPAEGSLSHTLRVATS